MNVDRPIDTSPPIVLCRMMGDNSIDCLIRGAIARDSHELIDDAQFKVRAVKKNSVAISRKRYQASESLPMTVEKVCFV